MQRLLFDLSDALSLHFIFVISPLPASSPALYSLSLVVFMCCSVNTLGFFFPHAHSLLPVDINFQMVDSKYCQLLFGSFDNFLNVFFFIQSIIPIPYLIMGTTLDYIASLSFLEFSFDCNNSLALLVYSLLVICFISSCFISSAPEFPRTYLTVLSQLLLLFTHLALQFPGFFQIFFV